jgi:hypothetical protein
MFKQLSQTNLAFAKAASVITVTFDDPSGQGWEEIPQVTGDQVAIANRTYIDLAGYTQEELTTFVRGVDIQKDKSPLSSSVVVCWEYDILSTRRITDEELQDIHNQPPGFMGMNSLTGVNQTLDLMQVVYGEHQTFANNANIPGTFITTGAGTFGSGNPSASDRLHWTKVYLLGLVGGDTYTGTFNSFPCNLVVQALTDKESDLVWIERLRRSHVLQNRSED